MDSNNTAVAVNELTVAYSSKPVLCDIDLLIPRGQLVAIVGPNGAGKTTLLKAILGLVPKISGSVSFPFAGDGRVRNLVGYVPQNESVDWDFPATVQDVVLMGRYGRLGWFKRPRREDKDIAAQTLEKVGMAEYAGRQISQLSGGQQQRVFLARALAQQAEIYFMDEPFKGVDAQTEKTIVALLKQLRSEGKTVITVHHDLQTVSEYFDWVTLINRCVVASGPVESAYTENNLAKTYGKITQSVKGVA